MPWNLLAVLSSSLPPSTGKEIVGIGILGCTVEERI